MQDEPANMGPAPHYRLNLFPGLDRPVKVIARPPSSSPSVGQHSRHVEELKQNPSEWMPWNYRDAPA